MPGERGRFARHAFHHVAVAADRINIEIEDRRVRPVVARREPTRCDRHADTITATLAERSGRGLDPGSMAVFRMASGDPVELAESVDRIENFRQLDSVAPGHPEYGHTTGVET